MERKDTMTFKELTQTYDRPLERIRHMSNGQIALCTFGMFAFMTLVTLIIYPMSKGMPLFGLPKEKNIVQVEVTNTRREEPVVVTEDADLIFVARDAAHGYLNHRWTKEETVPDEEFFMTVKYTEKDGTVTELSVSDSYLKWNGEFYYLMEPGVFSGWIEAGFYDKILVIER